jgi:3',5'-cyclic AMP phosphodiesterase CpdA
MASEAHTYFNQSFFYTSNHSSSTSASSLRLYDNYDGNASNIGDDLRTLREAAVIGSSGEPDCSSDLIVVAGDELVGSSAGEGRQRGEDNNGETHVERVSANSMRWFDIGTKSDAKAC